MPPEDDNLRASLESAFDATPPSDDAPPPPAPSGEAPPPAPSGDAPPPAPSGEAPPPSGRDASGRFMPKDDKKAPPPKVDIPQFVPPKDGKPPEVKPPEGAKPPEVKSPEAAKPPADIGPRAPVSWKPEVREKWAGLPPEVKNEVMRREAEVQTVLRESSDARELSEQFLSTIAPYEAFIRAENSDPFKAIQYMMDTAVALRTSPPAQRAQLVANIVKQYGIDIEMLDGALAGQANPQAAQETQLQQILQRELAPVRQFMTGLQGQMKTRQQATQQQVQSEIETFATDPANEYYDDVADTMADLLEAAGRRGHEMSLATAYERACFAHPEISKLVTAKRLTAQAQGEQQRANAARAAGSSMPSGAPPLVPPNADTMSLRDTLAAAIDSSR